MIQEDTRAAIRRIQATAAETKEVGVATLEELQEQREQLHRIKDEGDRVQGQLKTAERLQNRLSRLSLNFNGRAARRQAKKETEFEKERDEIKQKRREAAATFDASVNKSRVGEQTVVVTPHGRANRKNLASSNKMGRGEPQMEVRPEAPKGLLYGLNSNGRTTTDPRLQRLAEADAEIDEELDKVGNQLDELLQMAETISLENKGQTKSLNAFSDQMTDINHQQQVVNKDRKSVV